MPCISLTNQRRVDSRHIASVDVFLSAGQTMDCTQNFFYINLFMLNIFIVHQQ